MEGSSRGKNTYFLPTYGSLYLNFPPFYFGGMLGDNFVGSFVCFFCLVLLAVMLAGGRELVNLNQYRLRQILADNPRLSQEAYPCPPPDTNRATLVCLIFRDS